MNEKALVLMYYGFPETTAEMTDYLKDILRGRQPPQSLVDENIRKLNLIGGKTPSTAIVKKIGEKLRDRMTSEGFNVYLLTKHYKPSLKDARGMIKEEDVYEAPLFPIYSKQIFDEYFLTLENALGKRHFHRITNIGFSTGLIEYYKQRIGEQKKLLVFSAHSIPIRGYDPYPSLISSASRMIAGDREYINIYHSQGPFAKSWLGPYPDYCISYARRRGFNEVILSPIGFLYEHIEILYDLDWDLKHKMESNGLKYSRIPSPNDDDAVIDAIADSIGGESFPAS
ncbi:MAG: ferrochelatase [Candidatus Thermoplasmatota archaeon]|nr:ferrochelatase [Candidatus Thermoplasmatota archaeon]